jgi:glycosyltransferase involved in cell wall biosynthesis
MLIKKLIPKKAKTGLRDLYRKVKKRRYLAYMRGVYNLSRFRYYERQITLIPNVQKTKVSVVIPCFNTPKKYFEPLLESIFAQGYGNWELVIVDASNNPMSREYLKNRSESDIRIKYCRTTNKGIALNTNVGLEKATGDLIAFMDHDDTLDPNALAESVVTFENDPEIGLVYSDEDKLTDDGEEYFHPHFKPDFSLDLLRNVNYITHLVVVRKVVVDKLGGIRKGFDGAQDFDFLLRVVDEGVKVVHIPKVLYHWRHAEGSTAADFSNKSHITKAGCQALLDHYHRRGIKNVTVEAIKNRPGFYRANYRLTKKARKVLLNIDQTKLSKPDLQYILEKYTNNTDIQQNDIRVELVDDVPDKKERGVTTLVVNGLFFPHDKNTDIISLFGLAEEEGVGGVSPKITHQGSIHDMGLVYQDGQLKALFKGLNPNNEVPFGSLEWVRDVNELTDNVTVAKQKIQTEDRKIVWTHSDFDAFVLERPLRPSSAGGINFYNDNLTEKKELITVIPDYPDQERDK